MKHLTITPDSPPIVVLAVNVRRFRTEQGMAQQDLAAQCGCSQSTISYFERALIAAPAQDIVDRIAVALGVEAAVLFTRPSGGAA